MCIPVGVDKFFVPIRNRETRRSWCVGDTHGSRVVRIRESDTHGKRRAGSDSVKKFATDRARPNVLIYYFLSLILFYSHWLHSVFGSISLALINLSISFLILSLLTPENTSIIRSYLIFSQNFRKQISQPLSSRYLLHAFTQTLTSHPPNPSLFAPFAAEALRAKA